MHIGEENSDNEMLQRIYGTSWSTQKELDDYLKELKRAEKRPQKTWKRDGFISFQRKVRGQFFGMIEAGIYFKN